MTRRKLPPYVLVTEREYNHVTIRAVTRAKAFQQRDSVADWMDAHKSVPGEIGYIKLSGVGIGYDGKKKLPMTDHIRVREELHRSGLGTKLYEAAAAAACAIFGQPLASDQKRTAASQAFWIKQVRKKRARCVKKGRLFERGAPPDRSIDNRGGCAYYQLKSCSLTTLGKR